MDMADLADRHIEAQLQVALAAVVSSRGATVVEHRHCRECGVVIPLARRRALPYVTTCVNCAEARELYGRHRVGAGSGVR